MLYITDLSKCVSKTYLGYSNWGKLAKFLTHIWIDQLYAVHVFVYIYTVTRYILTEIRYFIRTYFECHWTKNTILGNKNGGKPLRIIDFFGFQFSFFLNSCFVEFKNWKSRKFIKISREVIKTTKPFGPSLPKNVLKNEIY